jgi:F-type H+-transporting ATPase subunit epsilon
VTIRTGTGEDLTVAAHGGFLSVSEKGVSILAETAEISTEIDVARAREALQRAESAGDDDVEALDAARRAQSRLRAAGETV